MAFAPDGRRVLFCRANDDFSSYEIYKTEGENGRWRAPVKPSFAQSWSNADPHFSSDGRTVPLGDRFDTPRNDASIAGIGNGKGDIYRIGLNELGLGGR